MDNKPIILKKEFEGFAEKSHSKEDNSKELIEDFRKIANAIICGGYILVTSGHQSHRIYIDVVEFYFHNETGDEIKDYAMYHRDKVKPASINNDTDSDVSYFKLGEINMHMSGFDITFENDKKNFRASALIRAYRFVPCDKKWYDIEQPEKRSTFLYDDFLKGMSIFDGISIKWIDDASDKRKLNPESYPRKNIKYYSKDGEKDKTKPCDRKWSFSLEGISMPLK